MGIENFITYLVSAFIFILTPGIDTIFIINKSVGQGKKAGIYSSLGINSGILFHTFLAAMGLSIILAKSAVAFMFIKYLGAAYLLYLGISKFISKDNNIKFNTRDTLSKSNLQNFNAGFITNIFNPKVALFFLAFFPQFIKRDSLTNPLPFMVLGVTYALIGLLWFCTLTCFISFFSARLIADKRTGWLLNKFSGLAFILMGIKVALTKK